MKIEEQVLSIEQMYHLQELGIDTSDASMRWVGNDVVQNIAASDLVHDGIFTYTIGDLIEKLPKRLHQKDSRINICSIYGSRAFEVWYDKVPSGFITGVNIKDALYKELCWVARNNKELLDVKK